MNYISLINQFWAKDLEHSFTPNDIAVYFRLLERCNALGWKNPFNFSVDELLLKLRLKTKDPLDTARNRLKQAGLIDFKNGQGRGYTTSYWLVVAEAEEENPGEKGKKNTPFSPPFMPTFSPPFSPPQEPLLHKTKLNQTKEKTANAVSVGASEGLSDEVGKEVTPSRDRTVDPPPTTPSPPSAPTGKRKRADPSASHVVPTPPAAVPLVERYSTEVAALSAEDRTIWDQFVAWEMDNPVPKLFQMKEPLLPAQLVKLKRKHSADQTGLLGGVLLDMQNRPKLLTEYESANLTIQSWIRRRQQ